MSTSAPGAPQGSGTGGAEGGHPVDFGDFGRPASPVPSVPGQSNREVQNNVVQQYDVTRIANDDPNDRDYDNPYPASRPVPTRTQSRGSFNPVTPES